MTEQEQINANLQRQIDAQSARTDGVLIKLEDLIREFQDFKAEMRENDRQRVEDMREIRASIDGMGNHVRNLVWTSMAAIGAMVVTVIISLLRT